MKTELTDEQKNELRAKVADAAEKGAGHAAEKAKNSTGWAKIIWIILAVLLAGAALFLETGCGQITQEQMQVAGQVVHEIYHVAHPDKPCILVLPVDDIDK